jgi:hypothetical protein
MTKIDKFVAFARDLPREQLDAIEARLDEIMESYSPEHDLTDAEIAEVKKRMADPDRKRADRDAVARIFGQQLPG